MLWRHKGATLIKDPPFCNVTNVRVCSQKYRRHRSVSPTNPPSTSISHNVTFFRSVGKRLVFQGNCDYPLI